MEKKAYPCPCGGKIKWKREQVVRDSINCGILDIEYCEKCGQEYFPEESLEVVEQKLREAGLWGVQRKEIKFWKSGTSLTTRFPKELVDKLQLDRVKRGFMYSEGKNKICIEF